MSYSFTSHHQPKIYLENTWYDLHMWWQHKTNEMCFRNQGGADFLFLFFFFFFLNDATQTSAGYLKGNASSDAVLVREWLNDKNWPTDQQVSSQFSCCFDVKTLRWRAGGRWTSRSDSKSSTCETSTKEKHSGGTMALRGFIANILPWDILHGSKERHRENAQLLTSCSASH